MAQWVKVLVAKSDSMSSIPGPAWWKEGTHSLAQTLKVWSDSSSQALALRNKTQTLNIFTNTLAS